MSQEAHNFQVFRFGATPIQSIMIHPCFGATRAQTAVIMGGCGSTPCFRRLGRLPNGSHTKRHTKRSFRALGERERQDAVVRARSLDNLRVAPVVLPAEV